MGISRIRNVPGRTNVPANAVYSAMSLIAFAPASGTRTRPMVRTYTSTLDIVTLVPGVSTRRTERGTSSGNEGTVRRMEGSARSRVRDVSMGIERTRDLGGCAVYPNSLSDTERFEERRTYRGLVVSEKCER